jgi:hypothetical protein
MFAQLSVACIGFSVYRYVIINQQLGALLVAPDTYANFEYIAYVQSTYNYTIAIMVFCAWIKVRMHARTCLVHTHTV